MTEYPYLPNSSKEIKEKILKYLNVDSVMELYNDVPEKILFKEELKLPNSTSENEVIRKIDEELQENYSIDPSKIFVGAGVWPHLIPTIIPALISRGEFLTAYTP
jgi:glycine dehydrogenase subunit 1